MNNLSNAGLSRQDNRRRRHHDCLGSNPLPPPAIYVLLLLLVIGLGFSIFIFVVVHNAVLLLLLLCLAVLVASFLLWNSLNYRKNTALLFYLHSFPDSDLSLARHGQLVKVTGVVSCGNVSLESSYEKVSQCIYTSTLLYEFGDDGESCFQWRLVCSERFTTDFYITDRISGIRALVNAGSNSNVIPLVIESRLIKTTRKCRVLSSHLRKWLRDRNLSDEARALCLEEGYIKSGGTVSIIGMFHKQNDEVMIVKPREIISTGCLWQKLLFPADFDGLILGTS